MMLHALQQERNRSATAAQLEQQQMPPPTVPPVQQGVLSKAQQQQPPQQYSQQFHPSAVPQPQPPFVQSLPARDKEGSEPPAKRTAATQLKAASLLSGGIHSGVVRDGATSMVTE